MWRGDDSRIPGPFQNELLICIQIYLFKCILKVTAKCNQETETQQPEQQLGQSKDVADDLPTMQVQPAAVINYVSCTSKQIKNRRRGYYWCPRKAVKLVGVDVEMLSAADFATYNKKCKFFMWLD